MRITRVHSIVLEQIRSAAWVILPEKLEAILEVVERHSDGIRLTAAEIEESIPAPRVDQAMGKGPVDGVQVIKIIGTISARQNMFSESSGGVSAEKVGQQLRSALADPNVGSIVLEIDSPGGTVSGTADLAGEIFAARSRKPIVALANDLAASGGYWLGSAATEMYSAPLGHVGSIGVITAHEDVSKLEERIGVKTTVISAGRLKAATSPYAPLSDEGRAIIQGRVDAAYAAFTGDVARNRGVPLATVKSGFGEGAVVTAKDAKSMGMIDGLATMDQAINRARQLARKQRASVMALNETHLLGL
jgi:capsid assembly protease